MKIQDIKLSELRKLLSVPELELVKFYMKHGFAGRYEKIIMQRLGENHSLC